MRSRRRDHRTKRNLESIIKNQEVSYTKNTKTICVLAFSFVLKALYIRIVSINASIPYSISPLNPCIVPSMLLYALYSTYTLEAIVTIQQRAATMLNIFIRCSLLGLFKCALQQATTCS